MRIFKKEKAGEVPRIMWTVTDYYKADNYDELMEAYFMEHNPILRGTPPWTGGPVVAYFIEEKDADEYCEFKNKQITNGK